MNLNLQNIGLGAVGERFDEELARVIENVLDENTCPKTKRKIKIEMVVVPGPEHRELCSMETKVYSVLAGTKKLTSQLTVGMDKKTGEVDAVEHIPQQGKLFPEPEKNGGEGKVRQLNG